MTDRGGGRRAAGQAGAEELLPRGGRQERMKGPRPASMPGYGAESKRPGRGEKGAEWPRFYAPQAPGNSHCAPTAPGNSHCAPTQADSFSFPFAPLRSEAKEGHRECDFRNDLKTASERKANRNEEDYEEEPVEGVSAEGDRGPRGQAQQGWGSSGRGGRDTTRIPQRKDLNLQGRPPAAPPARPPTAARSVQQRTRCARR